MDDDCAFSPAFAQLFCAIFCVFKSLPNVYLLKNKNKILSTLFFRKILFYEENFSFFHICLNRILKDKRREYKCLIFI
jgi:hypothetical protein